MQILYVEDDPRLRRHVLHDLLKSNHDVVEACDGTQACWLLQYHGADIDLVITDIDLGGELDGWAVAQHARSVAGSVRIIYATGKKLDHQMLPDSVALLKPFSSNDLEQAIVTVTTASRH